VLAGASLGLRLRGTQLRAASFESTTEKVAPVGQSIQESQMRKQVVVTIFDETANTFRYREVNSAGTHIHGDQEGAVIGDIYISKAARPWKEGFSPSQPPEILIRKSESPGFQKF
jgi:hypothetical protein